MISTTRGKSRRTIRTLHESELTRRFSTLSKQKCFCVLLENDNNFYLTDFANLRDNNPNFVNPFVNIRDTDESLHQSFAKEMEIGSPDSRLSGQSKVLAVTETTASFQADLQPGWQAINLKEARVESGKGNQFYIFHTIRRRKKSSGKQQPIEVEDK
jgi:hypothetical protein